MFSSSSTYAIEALLQGHLPAVTMTTTTNRQPTQTCPFEPSSFQALNNNLRHPLRRDARRLCRKDIPQSSLFQAERRESLCGRLVQANTQDTRPVDHLILPTAAVGHQYRLRRIKLLRRVTSIGHTSQLSLVHQRATNRQRQMALRITNLLLSLVIVFIATVLISLYIRATTCLFPDARQRGTALNSRMVMVLLMTLVTLRTLVLVIRHTPTAAQKCAMLARQSRVMLASRIHTITASKLRTMLVIRLRAESVVQKRLPSPSSRQTVPTDRWRASDEVTCQSGLPISSKHGLQSIVTRLIRPKSRSTRSVKKPPLNSPRYVVSGSYRSSVCRGVL